MKNIKKIKKILHILLRKILLCFGNVKQVCTALNFRRIAPCTLHNKTSLFLVLYSLFLITSCSKNTTTLTNIVSGELHPLPVSKFVLSETPDGKNLLVITLTWSKTTFSLDGKEVPVGNLKYLMEADIAGNNFANSVTIAAADNSTSLSANIFLYDLNTVLRKSFNAVAGQEVNLEFRLKTEYGENGTVNNVYSLQTISAIFVPFMPANELNPVYLIGDMDDWNLNSRKFLMYRSDNKGTNHVHTYTGLFGANTHFKFCSEPALGDEAKMFGKKDATKLEVGGEDFVIETTGLYTLIINDKTLAYSIESYTGNTTEYAIMGFVGAFCAWGANGTDPEMTNFSLKTHDGGTVIDPHNWYLEIQLDNIEYGVKFRANHGWENRWCPLSSSNNPYGIAEKNPSSGDPNIDISTQGLGYYEVRFNDLTGHYFVKLVSSN